VKLKAKYLLFYLRHVEGTLAEKGNGSTFHAISRDDLSDLPIPLPSPGVQESVAATLTEALETVAAARRCADTRLAAAEALPAAYLSEVFEGAAARHWELRRIADVAPIQTGFAFKSEWFVEAGGVRLLRNANIHQGFVEWVDVVAVADDMLKRFSSYSLEKGDIVLTLDRPIVANGLKVARVTSDDLPALLNQRVARFRTIPACVERDYLYAFLRAPIFMSSIRGHDQSLGVPHISPTQVEYVQLPLPSIALQRHVVRDIAHRLKAAEGLISRCREELAAIDALPASLLRAAFNGQS